MTGKPSVGWTVRCFGRVNEPSLVYVHYTRSGVWRAVEENTGMTRQQAYRQGWRVGKVRVSWA